MKLKKLTTAKHFLERPFETVRKGFRILFENCTEEQSLFLGNAIGNNISAKALGYISFEHTIHHINIIKERYLCS